MTREEREAAIAYIKWYRKLDENLHNIAPKDSISYYATDKCLKYWDMAIQALSQEQPCDDAVSREAVIKTINNNTADERDGWLCIDNDLVHEIEKLPSVTPTCEEREKGECPYYAG